MPLPGNGLGFIRRDWKSVFDEAGLRGLEDFFSIQGKALSKPGLGKRYRAQVELTRDGKTVSVFYKRYSGENLRNLIQRWFEDDERTAVALREVRVANELDKIGIATFKPLAWGWKENWGVDQKSFVVMSQVPGNSIQRWLLNKSLGWREKLRLVEQIASFAKHLHESGWFHRDFYLCHIFINESNGAYELALVDLARMFCPRWRVNRWRIQRFGPVKLFHSSRTVFTHDATAFRQIVFGLQTIERGAKIVTSQNQSPNGADTRSRF